MDWHLALMKMVKFAYKKLKEGKTLRYCPRSYTLFYNNTIVASVTDILTSHK